MGESFHRNEIEGTVPAHFAAQVKRYGTRIAVSDGRTTLTYNALSASAGRIAAALGKAAGPGKEPVALLLEHGNSAMVGIFAPGSSPSRSWTTKPCADRVSTKNSSPIHATSSACRFYPSGRPSMPPSSASLPASPPELEGLRPWLEPPQDSTNPAGAKSQPRWTASDCATRMRFAIVGAMSLEPIVALVTQTAHAFVRGCLRPMSTREWPHPARKPTLIRCCSAKRTASGQRGSKQGRHGKAHDRHHAVVACAPIGAAVHGREMTKASAGQQANRQLAGGNESTRVDAE